MRYLLNSCFVNSSLQTVNRAAHDFELRVIVGRDGCFALRLQFTNARLDGRFVDADDIVMLVLNAQSLGQRHDEMLFVQLGVALNCFVLATLRHVAQLGKCLVS